LNPEVSLHQALSGILPKVTPFDSENLPKSAFIEKKSPYLKSKTRG
jgi:hypothetical protein